MSSIIPVLSHGPLGATELVLLPSTGVSWLPEWHVYSS